MTEVLKTMVAGVSREIAQESSYLVKSPTGMRHEAAISSIENI